MNRLEGKVAIVTGAGAGIGRATAELFAEEGAAVVVAEIDAATGAEAAAAITRNGGRALFVRTDVADENSARQMIAETVRAFGRVNVVVNNAVVFVLRGIDATPEDWRRSFDVSVMGTALVSKHAVPEMRKVGGGSIVNLGSISSFIAQPELATYNSAKAAVSALTRCMALDLAKDNIRVNAACPGVVWTKVVEDRCRESGMDRAAAELDPGWGGASILKRIADPREIAYAILFLASDEASYVTGSNMMIDGGYTAL